MIAGAGSGKTTSLIGALDFLREAHGNALRQRSQRVVCITYTKRARDVINERLNFDPLFEVATIHSFLWSQVKRFTGDIRKALSEVIIPQRVKKAGERDNGGNSETAKAARRRVAELNAALEVIGTVTDFRYEDSQFSDFGKGLIGHDDVIDLAAELILSKPLLRRIIGHQFPYIFVDEAQDTFPRVVEAFNAVCSGAGLPIVGYFGDPMQQIYETGIGDFNGPQGSEKIDKVENYRSAKSVVRLANHLRSDIQQEPKGENADIEGVVSLTLIRSEEPLGERKRYTEEQLERALARFDAALAQIGWKDGADSKRLYLVRQMIARRLGFSQLHSLFTGRYASSRAQDDYENGSHHLLKPFTTILCPLMKALEASDQRQLLDVLRTDSPRFSLDGPLKESPLKGVLAEAKLLGAELSKIWKTGTVRDILVFAQAKKLTVISERLANDLARAPRVEEYDEKSEAHVAEKSDWLADAFLSRNCEGLVAYADFVADSTAFSTQHGVKGEEYENVLVVFDDVDAAWNQYSFTKLLVPGVAGAGTDGQMKRSRKLAYVCFTRARKNLFIILFCPDPEASKAELVANNLFSDQQVKILNA